MIMMKMIKTNMMKTMTKKMNQTRIRITSQSTLDYQDYCVLRCLLCEAGYNPNDTHWNSRVKKGPDLLLQ
jgi:hypothetical protein